MQSLRDEVLQQLHTGVISGHFGEQKMLNQMKERYELFYNLST